MTPCELWQGSIQAGGYGYLTIDGRHTLAHRHVWETAHGPIPDGQEVRHLCHVRACVRLDHLAIGTHAENMADSRLNLARVSRSHLTEQSVIEIRQRAAAGERFAALAREYGMAASTISSIVHRYSWRHVP